MLVHGPGHLAHNTWAVAVFLAGAAAGLCLLALAVSGGLKLATQAAIARTWWPSLLAIIVLSMAAFYLLEVTAL